MGFLGSYGISQARGPAVWQVSVAPLHYYITVQYGWAQPIWTRGRSNQGGNKVAACFLLRNAIPDPYPSHGVVPFMAVSDAGASRDWLASRRSRAPVRMGFTLFFPPTPMRIRLCTRTCATAHAWSKGMISPILIARPQLIPSPSCCVPVGELTIGPALPVINGLQPGSNAPFASWTTKSCHRDKRRGKIRSAFSLHSFVGATQVHQLFKGLETELSLRDKLPSGTDGLTSDSTLPLSWVSEMRGQPSEAA